MGARVRDIDGQRHIEVECQGGSVFISGHGFCYEFDRGILFNALRREFGLIADSGVREFSTMVVTAAEGKKWEAAGIENLPLGIIPPATDAATA